MSNPKQHPDKQYDQYCQTCTRMTKQVIIDKGAYYCTVCCSVNDPPLPDTNETLKAIMEVMSQNQHFQRELINAHPKK